MKNYYLIFLLLPFLSFGQDETVVSKKVATDFVTHYNAGEYTKIFDLFGSDMQAALPIEQTSNFLQGLHDQAGAIDSIAFRRYEVGSTYAVYKTSFEKAIIGINISLDGQGDINGLFVKPYVDVTLPELVRNTTPIMLPFHGKWSVFWGGDTKELNYHVQSQAQKNAFDFIIVNKEGNSYKSDGQSNEDYYAFGKELIAPCDAEVVLSVDGIRDNVPGLLNPIYIPGNTVILKTELNEYLFFAHFKQNSILVKEGDKVTQGDVLGLCGNSGNSSEPHLHFHIQNVDDMNVATGAKCFFDSILVNGEVKRDYSPIKSEIIENGVE